MSDRKDMRMRDAWGECIAFNDEFPRGTEVKISVNNQEQDETIGSPAFVIQSSGLVVATFAQYGPVPIANIKKKGS